MTVRSQVDGNVCLQGLQDFGDGRKGSLLAVLWLETIRKLENVGAIIEGVIYDVASSNRKMWSEFGISGDMSSTCH